MATSGFEECARKLVEDTQHWGDPEIVTLLARMAQITAEATFGYLDDYADVDVEEMPDLDEISDDIAARVLARIAKENTNDLVK